MADGISGIINNGKTPYKFNPSEVKSNLRYAMKLFHSDNGCTGEHRVSDRLFINSIKYRNYALSQWGTALAQHLINKKSVLINYGEARDLAVNSEHISVTRGRNNSIGVSWDKDDRDDGWAQETEYIIPAIALDIVGGYMHLLENGQENLNQRIAFVVEQFNLQYHGDLLIYPNPESVPDYKDKWNLATASFDEISSAYFTNNFVRKTGQTYILNFQHKFDFPGYVYKEALSETRLLELVKLIKPDLVTMSLWSLVPSDEETLEKILIELG